MSRSTSRSDIQLLELRTQSEMAQVRKELELFQRGEFAAMKSENSRLSSVIQQQREQIDEKLEKIKAGIKLDLSLDRSRSREEAAAQEHKIKDVNNRIDHETAALRVALETMKLDIIKIVAGSVISAATLILGYLRFLN